MANSRLKTGFSVYELAISIFILALIATAAVLNLRTTRMKDELNTGARVLASDLRGLQSRALSAQNVKTCLDAGGKYRVCENDTALCENPGTCSPKPPFGVGAYFSRLSATYQIFNDVEAAKNDWKKTDDSEILETRDLAKNGARNVEIFNLQTPGFVNTIDVAFERQNGSMVIGGCAPPCMNPSSLTISLRHKESGEIKQISLNAVTGRISIQ